jgi:hypothetical protein
MALLFLTLRHPTALAYRRPRPGPEPGERKAYGRYYGSLSPEMRAATARDLLWPPTKACAAWVPEGANGTVRGEGHAYRYAFLVQTTESRLHLTRAQEGAFLSRYPHIVAVGDPTLSGAAGTASSDDLVSMRWGSNYGQKTLAGILCASRALHDRFDFLVILDDDTAVNTRALDAVLRADPVRFDPTKPLLMGPRVDSPKMCLHETVARGGTLKVREYRSTRL